jgi:hypothetical protein
MAKIDLDSLGIEELAALRESATDKLMEKVATRRAELEKLSQYGKPAKKSQEKPQEKSQEPAPVAKVKKSDEKKGDETRDPIAKAA